MHLARGATGCESVCASARAGTPRRGGRIGNVQRRSLFLGLNTGSIASSCKRGRGRLEVDAGGGILERMSDRPPGRIARRFAGCTLTS
jgi:hypothetical protein